MDNVYGAVIMTQVIARVLPVHLTNVGQRQTAADPQTRPLDLAASPPVGCYDLHPPLSFISAQPESFELIEFILLTFSVSEAEWTNEKKGKVKKETGKGAFGRFFR